jgi:hypothetical protein
MAEVVFNGFAGGPGEGSLLSSDRFEKEKNIHGLVGVQLEI